MTQRTSPTPAEQSASYAYNRFNRAKFVVGASVAHVVNVAVQLQDARAQNIQQRCQCSVYLSDNPDGSTLTGTAPTTATAIGTNGVILNSANSGGTFLEVLCNASGQFDVNVTYVTAPHNFYLVVCTPDGGITVSPIIAVT